MSEAIERKRKTMVVHVTKDAKKLWSCANFRRLTSPVHVGKLPISSGEEVTIFLPGETPSPFCDALRAWDVAVGPKSFGRGKGFKVCEHQVDVPAALAPAQAGKGAK